MHRFYLTGTATIGALLLSACLSNGAFANDASQPVAPSPWDGYVAASAGYTPFENALSFFDDDDGFAGVPILSYDPEGFAGEVLSSAAYRFTNGFGIQGDAAFSYQKLNFDRTSDISTKSGDVAGHVFYRDQNFLVGAFGQFGVTDYGSRQYDIDRVYGGGEAQVFWGVFTLYGQAGFQSQDWGVRAPPDIDIHGFFISTEGRYFATDNLKLSLKAGYDTLDRGSATDIETVHAGAGVEYRFDGSQFSTVLNVNFNHGESGFGETNEMRILAGIKLNLGTDTLIERDRSGASLNFVTPQVIAPLLP